MRLACRRRRRQLEPAVQQAVLLRRPLSSPRPPAPRCAHSGGGAHSSGGGGGGGPKVIRVTIGREPPRALPPSTTLQLCAQPRRPPGTHVNRRPPSPPCMPPCRALGQGAGTRPARGRWRAAVAVGTGPAAGGRGGDSGREQRGRDRRVGPRRGRQQVSDRAADQPAAEPV